MSSSKSLSVWFVWVLVCFWFQCHQDNTVFSSSKNHTVERNLPFEKWMLVYSIKCIQSSQAFLGLLYPQEFPRCSFSQRCNVGEVLLGTHDLSYPDLGLQRVNFSPAERLPEKLSLKSTLLDHGASNIHVCLHSLLEGRLLLNTEGL